MSVGILPSKCVAAVFAICTLGGAITDAEAQISAEVSIPTVRIGIYVPRDPHLLQIPGYPVYYDPMLDSNLFFYDDYYWVFAQDNWYTSSWYDGPWDLVPPDAVPDFILRIPFRYYRRLPPALWGWDRDRPPRWREHWGRDWDKDRLGWDHGDRESQPQREHRPAYQRDYTHRHHSPVGEPMNRGHEEPDRARATNLVPHEPSNAVRLSPPMTPNYPTERRAVPAPPNQEHGASNRNQSGRPVPEHGNPAASPQTVRRMKPMPPAELHASKSPPDKRQP